jgi:UrcA family protein
VRRDIGWLLAFKETTMNTLSRKTLCSVAASGAAALITAAVAVPIAQATTQARTTEVSSVRVRVGDLDARRSSGAQRIYWRLERAAEQVCGEDSDTRMQLDLARLAHSCEQQAIEPAVDQIHTAPLTAIFVHHFPERRGTVAVEADGRG